MNCLRVKNKLSDNTFTPISGGHDGFSLINNRIANNIRDTWCKEFVEPMMNIQKMTNKVLERYLDCGKRANCLSLHERAMKLVKVGNDS